MTQSDTQAQTTTPIPDDLTSTEGKPSVAGKRKGRIPKGLKGKIEEQIIKCNNTLQNPTQQNIADEVGVARQTVADVLTKYSINKGELESYRDNQADIILGLQGRIVENITTEKLQKTSAKDLAICLGIAVEKHHLVTGKSTVNVASIISIAMKAEVVDTSKAVDI